MELQEQQKLDSWDDYVGGSFLKAVNVESDADEYICKGIEEVKEDDGSKRLRLFLERNGKEWDFDLNKTNAGKIKEAGIETPKDVVGRKLCFKEVLVRNPTTNKEVPSLRIAKVI